MNWEQVRMTLKQLKEFVFQRFGVAHDSGKGLELSSATMPTHNQNEAQPTAFRPDDRAKRSEFSLHIGC